MLFSKIRHQVMQSQKEIGTRARWQKPVAALAMTFAMVAGSLLTPGTAQAWPGEAYDRCGHPVDLHTNLRENPRHIRLNECYRRGEQVWFEAVQARCGVTVFVETNDPALLRVNECPRNGSVLVRKVEPRHHDHGPHFRPY